ncbi:spore ii p: stage ii sporulation protein p [Lucifera butyrica]|uniref:Spore ii p: stage ii sporulation protein p n=1 Tax=Lucifera butyrica TaxID=1351585 RepID=A0A498RB85_9FIRM|nr:stage II sporulation protein P [Lucifera butyrica]VBB08499.1 spore ii p: stage ii sporulation protein p [Lucifera butyrica]
MFQFLTALTALFFLLCISPAVTAAAVFDTGEINSGYITVLDNKGATVFTTGLPVYPGDEYINQANDLFEITTIDGALGTARLVQKNIFSSSDQTLPAQGNTNVTPPLIAIYHTHDDESFIPNDGRATIPGNGSIMRVGDAFAQRLSEIGYRVDHDKTLHDPHDANAYQRSRRTFIKLLKNQPAALFDVHRDSAPANDYRTTINGQEATKILLVVGRQNPNRNITLDYAKAIKGAADSKYPGLIRGIFMAHGNYNEDLSPRAMLLEIGTQYNTLAAAEHSAALFADVVPSFIVPPSYGRTADPASPPAKPGMPPDPSSGTASPAAPLSPASPAVAPYYDILAILGVLFLGSILYLYLSTGSWREAKQKLNRFRKWEFTNFLGPRRKRK